MCLCATSLWVSSLSSSAASCAFHPSFKEQHIKIWQGKRGKKWEKWKFCDACHSKWILHASCMPLCCHSNVMSVRVCVCEYYHSWIYEMNSACIHFLWSIFSRFVIVDCRVFFLPFAFFYCLRVYFFFLLLLLIVIDFLLLCFLY